MTAVDLSALADRLPAKATLDPVTGQVSYANGIRICHHARRTESVRDSVHRKRRKTLVGRRWVLRWTRRPVRVLRASCPDCPSWVEHIAAPHWSNLTAVLAPYVFPREGS